MKKRIGRALVGLIAMCLLTGLCTNPRTYCLLPIALRHQQAGNWCWVASEQMVLEYFSLGDDQCALVNRAEGGPAGSCPDVTGEPNYDLQLWYDEVNRDRRGLSWRGIVAQIHTAETPFVYGRTPVGGGSIGRHIMVVVGYAKSGNKKFVLINDPWPPGEAGHEADEGTNNFIIPFKVYQTGEPDEYEHWFDHVNISP